MSDRPLEDHGLPPRPGPDATRRTVHLRGIPADLFHELDVHFEDLVRELQLIAVGDEQGLPTDVHLRDLAERVNSRISPLRRAVSDQLRVGMAGGRVVGDAEVHVADTAPAVMRVLTRFMDEAEVHAQAGRLLTAPARPEILALLAWLRDEVAAQVEQGTPPRPFPSEG